MQIDSTGFYVGSGLTSCMGSTTTSLGCDTAVGVVNRGDVERRADSMFNTKYKSLLDLWLTRSNNELSTYEDDECRRIMSEDKYLTKLAKLELDFSKKLAALNLEFEDVYDSLPEVEEDYVWVDVYSMLGDKLKVVYDNVRSHKDEVKSLYTEVSARLELVDDGVEAVKVFKSYGILDNAGKLSTYKIKK